MKQFKFLFFIATIFSLFLIGGCQSNKLKPGEGYINVTGGKVWYKVVGSGDKPPLVLLHGGPGVPSYDSNPLAALSDDRPVIFIDQLGCGRSDRITDTTLMTIPAYVKELKEIHDALGLKDYYIFGHSWGTIYAVEYYFAHPEGIKGLMLSGPALDIPRWAKDADTLIATLPDSIQKAIRTNEKNGTYDSPGYQQAVDYYYKLYLARKQPWSADIDSAFAQTGMNVYMHMDGPSEFTLSGNLKDYDATGKLGNIKIPTLFIGGEYDEARPESVRYFASLVPGAKYVILPNAGHLSMQDNPEANNKAVRDFLNSIEK